MVQIPQTRPMCHLGRIMCLFLTLLLIAGTAQAQDGRIQPDGPPVALESGSSDASEPVSAERESRPERESNHVHWGGPSNYAHQLLPIIAMVLIFGGPLILIFALAALNYRGKRRTEEIRAATIQQALESGRNIPPELLRESGVESPKDYRTKGIRNLGLGLGLVVALSLLAGIQIGGLGFILVGIGASQLILWKLDQPKNDAS
jgi:hypothetical protein